MSRSIVLLVGLAVLLGGGVVHGLWTDRWRTSGDLERAVEKIESLPENLGDWKGVAQEQSAEALDVTGAVAQYSRRFTDPMTGEQVLVILLAGKPARMSVHRPEHCYRAAGYELASKPTKIKVTPADQPGTDLWTGAFVRDDPGKGTSQLRIFWTWYAGGEWSASDNPRWAFARQRVLYKLYVVRSDPGSTPLSADSGVRLLGQLLPVLNRTLAED